VFEVNWVYVGLCPLSNRISKVFLRA